MIDTHCHLDSEAFCSDLEIVLQNAKNAGITKFIIPGADLKDCKEAIRISEKYQEVFFASGIHPYHLDTFSLEEIKKNQNHHRCVAIGECGLDYFRLIQGKEQEEKQRQKDCLIAQIKLSIEVDLPLILHVREASQDIAEILREFPKARGVFHCFNADEVLLEFSNRFYYGIGGVLTFKNARRLLEVLPKIPKERLLLETDAPYLTPHPHRGERNEPKFIPLVAYKMQEILNLPLDEIEKICTQNTEELFDLS